MPLLFNSSDVLSSASDKANFFAENFSKNLILMTQISLYLLLPIELI